MTLKEAIELAEKAKAIRESRGEVIPMREEGSPMNLPQRDRSLPAQLYQDKGEYRCLTGVITSVTNAMNRGLPIANIIPIMRGIIVVQHRVGAYYDEVYRWLMHCKHVSRIAGKDGVTVEMVKQACRAVGEVYYQADNVGMLLSPDSKVAKMERKEIINLANSNI